VVADQRTATDQADSADVSVTQTDLDSLAMALEHVTKWREFYTTSGLQVLYFFLVAAALLSTAYVSALNGRLHFIAGAIALGGVALSATAYLVGRRQRDVARLADPPMAELESRLASILRVDSRGRACRRPCLSPATRTCRPSRRVPTCQAHGRRPGTRPGIRLDAHRIGAIWRLSQVQRPSQQTAL
jgi:hypothetical protein